MNHRGKERGMKEKNKNKNKEGRRETREYEGNGGGEAEGGVGGSERYCLPPRKAISKFRVLAGTHTFLGRISHPCGSKHLG